MNCRIILPPQNLQPFGVVNDKRHITLKAFISKGKQREGEYALLLHFGPKALSRYARELGILECIPDTDASK